MGVSGVDLSTLRGYWQAEGAGGGVPGAGGPDDFACPEDKKNPTRLLKDLQKRLKQDKHYLTSPNNVITRRTMCKDLDILILRENGMRRGKRTEIVDSAAEVDDFLWFFESRVLCEIDAEIAEIGTPDDLDAQGRQISYYTSKLIIFLKLIESLRVAGCYYARQKNTVKANEKFNEALQIAQALINGTAGSSPLARAAAQTRTFLIEKKVWTDKLGSFGYNDDRMRAVLGGVYKEMGRYSEAIAQYRLVVGAGGHQLQSGGYYDYLAESAVSLMECHDSIGAVLRKDRKMLEARGQYDAALSTISLVQAEINRNLVEGFAPDGETPLASAEFVVRFAEAACYAYLGQADCTADAALKKELQEKAIQLSTLYNATLAACRAGNGAAKVRELLEALGFNSAAHPHVFSRVPDIAAAIAKKGKKIDYNQFGTEIEQLGIEIRNALKSKDADKLTATIAKLVALLNNRKLL